MSDFIKQCKAVSEGSVEITERLQEVDGDITELDQDEQQAVVLTVQAVGEMVNSIDRGALESEQDGGDTDGQAGAGFY